MIPAGQEEIHAGIVSMDHFVLGPVEDSIVDRQHGSDGEDLLRALVPGQSPQWKNGAVLRVWQCSR